MINKFFLGTAQFGLDYGIANTTGKIKGKMASEILESAFSEGINNIDTAIKYGDSENFLGSYGMKDWNVVTKIPTIPKNTTSISDFLFAQIEGSLSRLKIDHFHGILIHDSEQLISNSLFTEQIFNSLKKMKKEGITERIGLSIYNPDDLNQVPNLKEYDIVQSPLNILDRRLVNSGWLRKLKDFKVEVQVRSIFLQGLLLMSKESRPDYFNRWNGLWQELESWLNESGLNIVEACTNFPFSYEGVDNVVIGVDTCRHLNEIISSIHSNPVRYPDDIDTVDLNLINPSFWEK